MAASAKRERERWEERREEERVPPACQHPVGLPQVLCDEVIDQRPDVRALPRQRHQSLAPHEARCVHPGDDALGSRLLVPGGAVDLTAQEEASDLLRLQSRFALVSRQVVVLNCRGKNQKQKGGKTDREISSVRDLLLPIPLRSKSCVGGSSGRRRGGEGERERRGGRDEERRREGEGEGEEGGERERGREKEEGERERGGGER